MAANVSACSTFSVQLLYKLIVLLFLLSSATIPNYSSQKVETLVIHSSDTADNAGKKLEVVQTSQVFAKRVTYDAITAEGPVFYKQTTSPSPLSQLNDRYKNPLKSAHVVSMDNHM